MSQPHYVQIPKDLNDIKQKFMFGLTKRQVISFGVGIAIGFPAFFITSPCWICQVVLLQWGSVLLLQLFVGSIRKTEYILSSSSKIWCGIFKDHGKEYTRMRPYCHASNVKSSATD